MNRRSLGLNYQYVYNLVPKSSGEKKKKHFITGGREVGEGGERGRETEMRMGKMCKCAKILMFGEACERCMGAHVSVLSTFL